MDPSHAWGVRVAAQLLTALLTFILTAALLWRLRTRGAWTVLLALPVMAVLLTAVTIYSYPHSHPALWGVVAGIPTGCLSALLAGCLLHSILKRD